MSVFKKIFFSIIMITGAGFNLWATSKLYEWVNPHPETASPWLRLTSEILIIPVYLLFCLLMFILVIVLSIAVMKILNIRPETKSRSREVDFPTSKTPSVFGYWFLIVFCGGLYVTALFFIIQDMIIRHIPSEDWIIILMASMLLGAPMMLGILQVRRIQRGEPLETAFPRSAKRVSPMVGYLIGGLFFLLLISLGAYFGWETNEFLKIARPAAGVVTRWAEHGSGRHSYQTLEVSFTTPDGKTHTLDSEHHSSISFLMPNVGQKVDLLYNPNDLADFRVNQFSEVWSQTIWCFFILIVMSAGVLVRVLRANR